MILSRCNLENMQKFQPGYLLFTFLGGLILLFIVAPLVGMVMATPIESIFETTTDKEVTDSIVLTLSVSLVTTVVFAIAAIPLAFVMARKSFPLKKWIAGIIDIPIVIPHSAAGIAVLGFISRDSVLGSMASKVGLDFVGHPIGIGLAMAFVSIPFLVNSARNGFEQVPERLEKAAMNLGASPIRVFFTISIPLAWRSVVTGLIMMFARGMSEFGAVVIVAYHPIITPVLIYERFGAFGLKYARPVSVIFIVVCLVFFVLLRWLASPKKKEE